MQQPDLLPDEPWFDSWRGIIFTHARVLEVVGPRLQEHSGISLAFLDVLGRLYDAPEHRLRMQELQRLSLFTRSGMTRLVDRVEGAGLVVRERVPGDRRGVSVALTPEGLDKYEVAIRRHVADLAEEFASRMTPKQHRAIADALAGSWRPADSLHRPRRARIAAPRSCSSSE